MIANVKEISNRNNNNNNNNNSLSPPKSTLAPTQWSNRFLCIHVP